MRQMKVDRNQSLISLWEGKQYTQPQLASMFNITQGRVSAIIYNRQPKYRYCNYCKCRVQGRSVCDSCRVISIRKQEQKRADKQIAKQQAKAHKIEEKHKLQLAKLNAKAEKRLLLETTRIDRYEQLLGKRLDIAEIESIRPCRWQHYGRERARTLVRKRDNFTCQTCGLVRTPQEVKAHNSIPGVVQMKNLDVHHLNGMCGKRTYGYDKVSELEIDGLITLCHKCHFNHPQHSSKH